MNKNQTKIAIIGMGYVGLPLAVEFGKLFNTLGFDSNKKRIDELSSGFDSTLEVDAIKLKKLQDLTFTNQVNDISNCNIYIICVPTPFYLVKELPTPNLEYVIKATESLVKLVKAGDIVILESTSPVGTTNKVAKILSENGVDVEKISIAYCPERVLPGKIMSELISNDRIVGGVNQIATQEVACFYETFVDGVVLKCSAKTAEMCKLAENSFRDVNIAFANELSMVRDTHGIDPWQLISLANHHPRVNILQPGTGVGGHCIAVDPWFIVSGDPEHSKIIKLARQVNDSKPAWVVNKIMGKVDDLVKQGIENPVVACLGLAFKPDIDDLRESPAVIVVERLLQLGIDIRVVEPHIAHHTTFRLTSLDDALEADLVVLLVKHTTFDDDEMRARLGSNTLDFCGALV